VFRSRPAFVAMKPRHALTLAQLRALEAVVRLGSFSAAAKDLGISQPSVSNHVIAAEAFSKASLVTRDGKTARATAELEAVLPQLRAIFSLCNDVERRFGGIRAVATGRLSIGYSTYQIAMRVLTGFMKAYPGIEVEARAMASGDVLDGMEAGALDVGFVTARELPSGCAGFELVSTPIVLVVRPDHVLARKGRASWAEIADLDLIQREGSSGTRHLFEGAARLAGVSLRTRLALGSWGSIVSMVRDGVGVGVAMAAELDDADGLVAVRIADDRLAASHFVVCQAPMAGVSAVSAFMQTARTTGQ